MTDIETSFYRYHSQGTQVLGRLLYSNNNKHFLALKIDEIFKNTKERTTRVNLSSNIPLN